MNRHLRCLLAAVLTMAVVMVSACGGPEGYLAGTAWYAKGNDSREIVVFASVGACDEIEKTETDEKPESVTVRIWAEQAEKCEQMVGEDKPVRIRLKQELGGRAVLSQDGVALRERQQPQ